MKQYEVLMAKELFAGSDIVRKFSYKTAIAGDTMPIFRCNPLSLELLTGSKTRKRIIMTELEPHE